MSRKTRKLIWSAPLVAVLAVAGALALFVALAPGAAQAEHEELPGPVTGLKADRGRAFHDGTVLERPHHRRRCDPLPHRPVRRHLHLESSRGGRLTPPPRTPTPDSNRRGRVLLPGLCGQLVGHGCGLASRRTTPLAQPLPWKRRGRCGWCPGGGQERHARST